MDAASVRTYVTLSIAFILAGVWGSTIAIFALGRRSFPSWVETSAGVLGAMAGGLLFDAIDRSSGLQARQLVAAFVGAAVATLFVHSIREPMGSH